MFLRNLLGLGDLHIHTHTPSSIMSACYQILAWFMFSRPKSPTTAYTTRSIIHEAGPCNPRALQWCSSADISNMAMGPIIMAGVDTVQDQEDIYALCTCLHISALCVSCLRLTESILDRSGARGLCRTLMAGGPSQQNKQRRVERNTEGDGATGGGRGRGHGSGHEGRRSWWRSSSSYG